MHWDHEPSEEPWLLEESIKSSLLKLPPLRVKFFPQVPGKPWQSANRRPTFDSWKNFVSHPRPREDRLLPIDGPRRVAKMDSMGWSCFEWIHPCLVAGAKQNTAALSFNSSGMAVT